MRSHITKLLQQEIFFRVCPQARSFCRLTADSLVARKCYIYLVLLTLSVGSLRAQGLSENVSRESYAASPLTSQEVISLMLLGGFSKSYSTGSIPALAADGNCGTYTKGDGSSPLLQIKTSFPWQGLALSPVISFENLSTLFTTHPTNVEHGYIDGALTVVNRERSYDAVLNKWSVGGLIGFPLFPNFQIDVGGAIGIYSRHEYNETEHITSPENAYYLGTSSSNKTVGSGTIETTLPINALAQASYAIALKNDLILRPTFQVSQSLNGITKDPSNNWKIFSVAGGVSIGYDFVLNRATKRIDTIPPVLVDLPKEPVTPPPAPKEEKKSILTLSVKAVGITKEGKEIEEPVLLVEKVNVTEAFPTLNYIFFNDGESAIPARYKTSSDTKAFNETSLFSLNAFEIHHHVLDILGSRMQKYPAAKLTLIGSQSENSTKDIATSNLGVERAQSVADYLTNKWNINPSRLTVKGRTVPEVPSDDRTLAGQAENRRVEVIPSFPAITAPLWAYRTEHLATPPQIDFIPTITSSAGVRSVTITVSQGNRVLQQFDGLTGGAAGEHLWSLDEQSMPTGTDSLKYSVEVIDSVGEHAYAEGFIRLRTERHESTKHATDTSSGKPIERFSLILFDYSSSQFDKKQAESIMSYVAKASDKNAVVTLTGHTDQTGNDEFNERLSEQRASSAYSLLLTILKQQKKPVPAISVESHGSRDLLFDNSVPEGRFLSRTVRITIEHPDRDF